MFRFFFECVLDVRFEVVILALKFELGICLTIFLVLQGVLVCKKEERNKKKFQVQVHASNFAFQVQCSLTFRNGKHPYKGAVKTKGLKKKTKILYLDIDIHHGNGVEV